MRLRPLRFRKEDTILCSLELVVENQGTGLGVEVRTKVESDARKKES